MRYIFTILAFFALPAHGDAISGGSRSSLLTGDYLLQIVGSFFLVICVLLAVLALLKKYNAVGPASGGHLRILDTAQLGQREKVVLLQVGNEQVLVGVASGSVNCLHSLSDLVSTPEDDVSRSFRDVWKYATNPRGGNA